MEELEVKKKYAIYSRKSKLTEKGESIENQVEMCRFLLQQKYDNIDFENDVIVYEDEGFSGGTINRPQFKKMMEDARKKKFSVIVCYRLDRLSRNISDFSKLIDELSKLGIEFISVKEKFETDTPMGRAMMYIASIFSQLEREVIAERIRDNMMELAKTGRWLGGTAPTGYESKGIEKVNINGKVKKAYMLVQIPDEAERISLICNEMLNLKSLTKLETYLIQKNIKTKNGRYYTRYTLKTILTNICYAKNDKVMYEYLLNSGVEFYADESEFDGEHGMIAYNKTNQRITGSNRHNEMDKWVIAIGKHKGIISGETFVKIQQLMKDNENMRYRVGKYTNSLLSGILFCGECGAHMRPKTTIRDTEDGNRRFYYMCEMKDKSKKSKCNSKNIDGNMADKLVIQALKEIISTNSNFCNELKSMIVSFEKTNGDINEKKKVLEKKYEQNQRDINNLINKLKYIDNELIEDVTNEIKNLKSKNNDIKQEMEQIVDDSNAKIEEKDYAKLMLDVISEYRNTFDTLDYKEQRNFLKLIISKVVAHGKDIDIHLLNSEGENQTARKIFFPHGEYCK